MRSMKHIDKYVVDLQQLLGSGTYARVYLARHLDGQLAAVKIIQKNSIPRLDIRQNVLRELKLISLLDHPNIIKFKNVYETPNNLYIVMEHCEGKVMLGRKMEERQILKIVGALVNAMIYLRTLNIVHRDIKPENIILTPDFQVKLIDFGFACQLHDLQTTVQNVGSPLYMSPQMLTLKPYSFKADIWALGVMSYQLCYGRPPWLAQTVPELVYKIFNQEISYPDGPSYKLKRFIQGCLGFEEQQRLNYSQLSEILNGQDQGSTSTCAEQDQILSCKQIKSMEDCFRSMKEKEREVVSVRVLGSTQLRRQQQFSASAQY